MNTQFTPLFSVVIPCYKVANYIGDCLESVLAQTFKSFEIICVDDGSPDNTSEIISQYSDDRIRVIHQMNRGLSGARNTGISVSRGIFIALLDADDLWLPTKLEEHFKHLQSDPHIGISYCASEFIDEDGKSMGIGQQPKLTDITPKEIFCRNPIGNGSAAVIRKSLLNSVSRVRQIGKLTRFEYFDENMRQSEDVEFWLRVALVTKYKFEGIDTALTKYRVNMSGLSANLDKQYASWLYSVQQNKQLNETFIKQWFSLASAYQKRYLSRRAIQSRNAKTALKLIRQAIFENPRILIEEPKRTLITLICAVLCALPEKTYKFIEGVAIRAHHQARLA